MSINLVQRLLDCNFEFTHHHDHLLAPLRAQFRVHWRSQLYSGACWNWILMGKFQDSTRLWHTGTDESCSYSMYCIMQKPIQFSECLYTESDLLCIKIVLFYILFYPQWLPPDFDSLPALVAPPTWHPGQTYRNNVQNK